MKPRPSAFHSTLAGCSEPLVWRSAAFQQLIPVKVSKWVFSIGLLLFIWCLSLLTCAQFRIEFQLLVVWRNARVEVPEIISAEQRCCIVMTFFSADSEDMKKISADQLCFSTDQLWFSLNQRCTELKNSALFQSWTALFQRETALNQRCTALIFLALKHWIFSAEQRWTALIQRWFTLN